MEPFLGQIMWAGFGFAPEGWAACNGALVPLSQNYALFALLGTTFGGDGRETFGLPDLGGAVALGDSPELQPSQRVALAGPATGPGVASGLVVTASIALEGVFPPRD